MRLRADIMDQGMGALAKAMIAEAWEGEDGKPADLIVVVDDVELHNFDQQPLICTSFLEAVELELAARATQMRGSGRSADDLRTRVRERCSFHLLCPMVEAYLFADRAALVTAGCAPTVEPRLVRPDDCENFESCDPSWLPTCTAENVRKAQSRPLAMPWWQEQRHAKHYLEHLVEQTGGVYSETHGGRRAFEALDWSRVPSSGYPLVRALLEDLADFFVATNPLGGVPSPLTYPGKQVDRRTLLLRNM